MPTWPWHWIGYGIAAIGVAAVLFWIVGDRSRGRPRCPRCWYDLARAGEPPLTCPECGREITALKHLHRPRRRKGHAIAALGLMLVGYASIATPRVLDRGWRGAVPTIVLAPLLPWLPQAWHDTEFYRTGIDDEKRVASRALMQAVMSENARIGAGTPNTLVEELACRWPGEPLIVQRLANHIWAWSYGSAQKPWYWNHGVGPEVRAGLMSMAWQLRTKSLHAGALSSDQAHKTRELALSRYAHPQIRSIWEDSTVPVQVFGAALDCRSPDAAVFEAALLKEDSDEVTSTVAGTYDHDRGGIAGMQQIGPLPYGTESATLRYTLLDAEGGIIDRHTVKYGIRFSFTLDEFRALPKENQRINWVTQWRVLEVNGKPVTKPRLP